MPRQSRARMGVAELGPDMPIAMDIGASLGWGSGSYNKSYWSGGSGVTSSKLNDLVLSVAFPVEIAGFAKPDDDRLKSLVESATGIVSAGIVGAYAVPLDGAQGS